MKQVAPATLVAIAVIVYAVANVAHEGLGHGVACIAAGGRGQQLNAIFFECDRSGLSQAAVKAMSAAGSLVNILLGALAWAVGRRLRPAGEWRYFWWLMMTVNLLQATGYWLFSGLGNIGDWGVVIAGWEPRVAWRAGLALAGAAGYVATIRLSLLTLAPMLGDGNDRIALGRRLTVVPYLVGGMLYVFAGFFNPYGLKLVLISAAAASLGGTSALAWMITIAPRAPVGGERLVLRPGLAWAIAGAVTLLLFVGLMGPGIVF